MAEEPVAQPVAFVRPFDQSGHVRRDEGSIARQPDDAEVGRQRGEGIVRDLRLRGGDARDDRRLAGVREADDADIGKELQLQPQILLFAGKSGLRAAGRAVGGRRVARVALAAEAALRDEDRIPLRGQVGDEHVLVAPLFEDLGPDRHFQRDVRARLAAPRGAFALRAVAGFEHFLESEIEQGIEVGAGDEINAAAVAAVAAVRPAARHELLAAEAEGPLAAVPGRDVDFYFVYKHSLAIFRLKAEAT
jgi:hypothetical protein